MYEMSPGIQPGTSRSADKCSSTEQLSTLYLNCVPDFDSVD